jgi:hypothetical protein
VGDIHMLVLWRRGESLQRSLDRLHAIAPDPTAGRAERDSMLPAFEGLERWLARPVRELLVGLVEAGAITITQVELADAGSTTAAHERSFSGAGSLTARCAARPAPPWPTWRPAA